MAGNAQFLVAGEGMKGMFAWCRISLVLGVFIAAVPVRAQLDETWTVTVAGQTVNVNADGSFVISNIPAPDNFGPDGPGTRPDFLSDDFLYLFGVSTANGTSRYVFSESFQISQGRSYNIGNLTFSDAPPPFPQSIRAVADPPELTVGQTSQITVTGVLVDGSPLDVTARTTGSVYRTSNTAIATVGENGLVTAHEPGPAFITIVNFGEATAVEVNVVADTVSTTIEGFVQHGNGSPVAGASVTTSLGGAAVTNSEGFFSIPLDVPMSSSASASASLIAGGREFSGNSDVIPVVPNGITDTGITVLQDTSETPAILFARPTIPSGDGAPESVVSGDLDGDGDVDLAFGVGRSVFFALNNGDGSYAQIIRFGLLVPHAGMVLGDLDGDGDLDIAVGLPAIDRVSVMFNNDDGSFPSAFGFRTGGEGPVSVAIDDFDGVNGNDLAVVNKDSATVAILLNNGSASFTSVSTFPVGSQPDVVITGDLDGVNGPDLAILEKGFDEATPGAVFVLLNNGSGGFGAAISYSEGALQSLAVADLDGDTDLDLVVTDISDGVSVLLNLGDGTFPSETSYPLDGISGAVAVVDLDSVNGLDLAVTDTLNNAVSVLINNGDGTYAAARIHPDAGQLLALASGDLDGDGDQDLIGADASSFGLSLLLNLGGGVFPHDVSYRPGSDSFFSVASGDWDRDGDIDLAVGGLVGGTIYPLFNGGAGTFVGGATLPVVAGDSTAGGGGCATYILSDDLNGDGDPDLITTEACARGILVRLGRGDGTFAPGTRYIAGQARWPVAAVDVDGANGPDIVYTLSGDVFVLFNDGQGAFGDPVGTDTGLNFISSIVSGNINGDTAGNADLVVIDNGNVEILLGNGDGTFFTPSALTTDGGARALSLDDLDGDGDPDLIVANTNDDDHVSVFINNGNGTFDAPVDYVVGLGLTFVGVNDVTGDNLPDIITANSVDSSISVLVNQGGGAFAIEQRYAVGLAGQGLVMADLDGDGDADVAVAGLKGSTGGVSVLLNRRFAQDCDNNGTLDEIDVANGVSADCNANFVPDVCDPDCNSNDAPDDCEVESGAVSDCNGNGLPDECEPDCNQNGVPDECDLSDLFSQDCNSNAIPDECDIASGTSIDDDSNAVPDECE